MSTNCIIVDMDGTLADVSSIRHHVRQKPKNFDAFHEASASVPAINWVVDIVREHKMRGTDVVIVTARKAKWRNVTAMFLALHDIPSDALFMRGDDDHRKDVEVKEDILAMIRKVWNPILAIDDNPSILELWQRHGIPTIEVPGWEVGKDT